MDRRLTQRGKERRRQLMDFAARRFAGNGYHPTSVSDIVQGMGVGKGVFYWYFSSKEELFLEILAEAQLDLRRRQQQAIADAQDPVQRIERGIRGSIEWLAEYRHLIGLFQFAASEERFAPALRRGQEVAVADVVHHVRDGILTGRIPDTDPIVVSHAILGVTHHLAQVFVFERDEPASAVADAAVQFCRDGLLGGGLDREGVRAS
ncbi:MAG: TetR/AcrR family transcriptional regulator [Actinobacteria bacterium]|nr:TetR/AcrR family transcriptional regulator [Actinomycetota bacterium]